MNPQLVALRQWVRSHALQLKWLHSIWALCLGVAVMLFFSMDFRYIRVIVGYLGFIWLASLVLHWEAERFGLTEERHPKVRKVVLYVIQNFYHEMLFFLLPLYYLSTTFSSLNVLFLLLMAAGAVVASFDTIYWRWMTQRSWISQGFYAFILFSCFNVFFPVVFGMRNAYSIYAAGMLSSLAFVSLNHRPREWFTSGGATRLAIGGAASLLVLFLVRGCIPPCPLRILSVEFGKSFESRRLEITEPVAAASELGTATRVYALALIKAPVGIHERVFAVWYLNGERTGRGREIEFEGGRESGFRFWAGWPVAAGKATNYQLDILTGGGQLIGRGVLPAR